MITQIRDIMSKDFLCVNVLDSVQKIRNIILETGINYFPVIENNEIKGIVTYKDLLKTHPNRIAADAMTSTFVSVTSDTSLWKAKNTFKKHNCEVLLVIDHGKLLGIVTNTLLDRELGKHKDLLTGLYKSEYIYFNTARLIAEGHSVTALFIDVNRFGFIDKEYGHAVGDIILKEIAMLLQSNIPEDAFLCRFGGDEFVVLMPYDVTKSTALAERLVTTVSNHSFYNNIPVSISAGIAEAKKSSHHLYNTDASVSKLINIASLASTKAKKENCRFYIANDDCIDESA